MPCIPLSYSKILKKEAPKATGQFVKDPLRCKDSPSWPDFDADALGVNLWQFDRGRRMLSPINAKHFRKSVANVFWQCTKNTPTGRAGILIWLRIWNICPSGEAYFCDLVFTACPGLTLGRFWWHPLIYGEPSFRRPGPWIPIQNHLSSNLSFCRCAKSRDSVF